MRTAYPKPYPYLCTRVDGIALVRHAVIESPHQSGASASTTRASTSSGSALGLAATLRNHVSPSMTVSDTHAPRSRARTSAAAARRGRHTSTPQLGAPHSSNRASALMSAAVQIRGSNA